MTWPSSEFNENMLRRKLVIKDIYVNNIDGEQTYPIKNFTKQLIKLHTH